MYKVILLDYSMPSMDGPTTATHIRNLLENKGDIVAAELQRPYICCCTAYDEAGFKKIALQSGMDKFINKPVSDDELNEVLQFID